MIELTFMEGNKKRVQSIELVDWMYFCKRWRDDEGRQYHPLSIVKIEGVS